MAGGLLAISAAVSALTRNQVIAFVLAAAICFLFLMSGLELVQAFFRGWAPDALVDDDRGPEPADHLRWHRARA